MKNTPNETKLNNKGFSLVELIIVIAIMAVLVGVLAPQFLKYVEQSRESADLDNYRAVMSAVQVYGVDNGLSTLKSGGEVVTIGTAPDATNQPLVKAALDDAGMDISGISTKSKRFSGKSLKFTDNGGNLVVQANDATLAKELGISNY